MWRWARRLKGKRVKGLKGAGRRWFVRGFFAKVLARSEVPAELAPIQEINRLSAQPIKPTEAFPGSEPPCEARGFSS